jgi:NAD(P)-dependent dehydrogenase (short-subunit alcohol dehydrogenase family)
MDYLKLKDKVVVITGGARGIGECAALSFASYDTKVIVCDLRTNLGEDVVNRIRENDGIAVYKNCDVTNPNQVRSTIADVIDEFGQIDILISNAGAGANKARIEDITDEEWYRVMEIDLKSCFNVCREVVPCMKKRKYGKIVVSSSGGGVAGMAYNAHYSAAKAALIAFAKSLCWELAEYNINVNAIAIPSIITPGTYDVDYDDDIETEIPDIPLGRLGLPEDVANMMLYLASDVSEYVSGQTMAPNGGKR